MGNPQGQFVVLFRGSLTKEFGILEGVTGGQVQRNVANLPYDVGLRRHGRGHPSERFELGDLRGDIVGWTVILEYDSGAVSIQNLLKYWPYVRGEMSRQPDLPILLCHFSDWGSWGSYRDLWQWLSARIEADPERRVEFVAKQFDHGGSDRMLCEKSVRDAVEWVRERIAR